MMDVGNPIPYIISDVLSGMSRHLLIFSVIVLSTASVAEPLLVIDPPRGLSLVLSGG